MQIAVPSTETELLNWPHGQTSAERLAASILRLDGFEGVDPQAPFGGPDGGKDILCSKEGQTFVAAVYFPKGQKTFATISKKFREDLSSSLNHSRDGFIFVTNQHLTPTERADLEKIASANGKLCLIYYRERLRIALDSPAGYGLRLTHLGIPMRPEEQFAYFAAAENTVAKALEKQTHAIDRLSKRIESLGMMQLEVAAHTVNATQLILQGEQPDVARMLSEAAQTMVIPAGEALSEHLSSPLVQLIHRLVVPGTQIAGQYRRSQVWLQDPTGQSNLVFEPPAWDQIPNLVQLLTQEWRAGFSAAATADRGEKIAAAAKFFHQFLAIHPFVDGNGRTARVLVSAIFRDLFNIADDLPLRKGAEYYRALRIADGGDLSELCSLLALALREVELS